MCYPDMDIPDIWVSLPFIWNVKDSLSNSRWLVWKISSSGNISHVIAPSSSTISWAKPWLFQSAERVVFIPQIRICSKRLLKVAQFSCFSHDISDCTRTEKWWAWQWHVSTVCWTSTGYHPVLRWFLLCEKSICKWYFSWPS